MKVMLILYDKIYHAPSCTVLVSICVPYLYVYRTTVPPYRTTIPYHRTVPPYRTTVPYHRTTVPYPCTVPPYRTTVPYHRTVPPYRTTVPYHCTVPPYRTTVRPYPMYPLWGNVVLILECGAVRWYGTVVRYGGTVRYIIHTGTIHIGTIHIHGKVVQWTHTHITLSQYRPNAPLPHGR